MKKKFSLFAGWLLVMALILSACTTPGTGPGSAGDTSVTPGVSGITGTEAVRLSELLGKNVNAGDQAIGQVDGVLVEHPTPPPAEETAEGEAAAATPTAAPTSAAAVSNDLFVRFVLVDVAGTAAAGTEGGQIVPVPWSALSGVSGDAVSLGIDQNTLASAPHTTLANLSGGVSDLGDTVAKYWNGKNVGEVPVTGETAANLALIPLEFRGIGIMDAAGEEVGSVTDLLFDPATGRVTEVEYSTGDATQTAPIASLTWQAGEGTALGSFMLTE